MTSVGEAGRQVQEAYPKIPLSELTHDLVFEITDLPGEVAEHYIRRAAISLARNANLLRRRRSFCIQPGVHNYLLESVDQMDLVAVMGVWKRTCCGASRPVRRLTSPATGWRGCGEASWLDGNEIFFQPANCDDHYDVNFSVAPTINACEIDSVFAAEFYPVLLRTALAIAYAISDKPWSDPRKAAALSIQAIVETQQLAVQTLMGGQRGLLYAKRPRAV